MNSVVPYENILNTWFLGDCIILKKQILSLMQPSHIKDFRTMWWNFTAGERKEKKVGFI